MSDPVIDRTMAVRIATQLGWEPKREWVGLTNAEVNMFSAGCNNGNSVQDSIRKAEAKLKEKNT